MMTFSAREHRVIAAMGGRANMPVGEIARITGYRDHSVRYCLSSLKERKALQLAYIVDELKLGLRKYEALLAVSSSDRDASTRVEQALIEAPQVWFATKLTGDFDYSVSLCVQNEEEVTSFFDELIEKSSSSICRTSFASYRGWTHFGSRYLHPKVAIQAPIRTGFSDVTNLCDPIDLAIVSQSIEKPLASQSQVARQVGIPKSTFSYRLERLQNLGVMHYPLFRVNSSSSIRKYKVFVKTAYPSAKLETKIVSFAARNFHIVEMLHLRGDWDYSLRIETEDSSTVRRLLRELRSHFRDTIEFAQVASEEGDLKWREKLFPLTNNDQDKIYALQ